MGTKKEGQLVPYELVTPGWEAEYTGESNLETLPSDPLLTYSMDDEGNVLAKYSLWGFVHLKEEDWDEEIRYINAMQEELGPLDENVRRIRQHIGGLICCDSGVPVTIDELLDIIGTGQLPEPSFHRGCWGTSGTRSTQPGQVESMVTIEQILKGFLDGRTQEELIDRYPYAAGFVRRTYDWLGTPDELTQMQHLMLERMFLNFDYLTRRNQDMEVLMLDCFSDKGKGAAIEREMIRLAGLPPIHRRHYPEFHEALATIDDAATQAVYTICCSLADGGYELSDCHHNTFRVIENLIYGIGTLDWGIPSRSKGAERIRLSRLQAGYALGLDRWLQGVPMQFLLLDLGHLDLGFDPKNEILRVYAYLGEERTPVTRWLAACLWYSLACDWFSGLRQHEELLASLKEQGISVYEWMRSEQSGHPEEDVG